MDQANLAAASVSAGVTIVVISFIVAQLTTTKDQLDLSNVVRGQDYLSAWGAPPRERWLGLGKPPPVGPLIEDNIDTCPGVSTTYLSRCPTYPVGEALWTVLSSQFFILVSNTPIISTFLILSPFPKSVLRDVFIVMLSTHGPIGSLPHLSWSTMQ